MGSAVTGFNVGKGLEFCPSCGKRLVPTRKSVGESVTCVLACPKCDYVKPITPESPVIPKATERAPQRHIAIIGEEEAKLRTMPTVKIECPKCGNLEAEWWMVQTRGADESPTQFFKCTRCGYTWREMA